MNSLRPSDDELHAYVDGRLEASRRDALERWLADHPADAERVAAWRAQNAALRAAFDPLLSEAVPQRLLEAATGRTRRAPSRHRVAAALGWLALGALAGFEARGLQPARENAGMALARTAAIAHAVYVPEVRHPVEVGADQETHLVQWLSKRLGTPLKVPDLAAEGYALVGGRLLPGDAGPVAQFMYQDDGGRRLTLYVRNDAHNNRETAFRFIQEGRIGVFYWLDGTLGYALSGEAPRERLLAVAEAAYRQLNP